jgi:hypothetical protein
MVRLRVRKLAAGRWNSPGSWPRPTTTPGDVLLPMPQLNRACTVRLAAISAALAGCRPEYFPTSR